LSNIVAALVKTAFTWVRALATSAATTQLSLSLN
jgi:hypothetical protein